MKRIVVLFTVAAFLLLPYFLFETKLFIGGDDTRMLYAYPQEFVKTMSLYSWSNVSSLSYYNPSFHFIPFALLWNFLYEIVGSRVFINYLAFSLPMVLGFIFMRKLLKEIFDEKYYGEIYVGALFYVLSPILIITQFVVFLTPVHLVAVFPIMAFLLLKYIKTKNRIYVLYASCWSIFFSFTFYTFAWIFGLIVPLLFAVILTSLFLQKVRLRELGLKVLYFLLSLMLSQLFWVLPFASSFLFASQVAGGNVFSDTVSSTFGPTVLATATGNILYPLLNLFHRQIISDFEWQYLLQYKSFYDKILALNVIYPGVLLIGILNAKKFLKESNYKFYLFSIISFVFALYLFTINVSVFKNVFLLMGRLPGFVMFRNYFDKFSIGYVFIFAICITGSLIVVNLKFKKVRNILLAVFVIVIVLNALPFKSIVNGPLWKTRDFEKTVEFNPEYLQLVGYVKNSISKDQSILTIPYNAAAYAVIPNKDGKGGYVGTSPLKVLTGVNDITGSLSFPANISGQFTKLLLKRNYLEIQKFIANYHINYILIENNLSSELRNGYFFDQATLRIQDQEFIKNLVGRKVFQSTSGSYALYRTKIENPIVVGPVDTILKINDVKYRMRLTTRTNERIIKFNETYHKGWKIYVADNENESSLIGDLKYLLRKPLFESTHKQGNDGYGNEWVFDGKASGEVVLYFKPELMLHIGLLCTILGFILQALLIWKPKILKNLF